jgi:hypothetical protein
LGCVVYTGIDNSIIMDDNWLFTSVVGQNLRVLKSHNLHY